MRFHQHLTLEINKIGRTFLCGDIHGQYDALMDKLGEVDFYRQSDRIIALGDLIDRGPDSLKCLRLLKEDFFYCLLGNHEDMMLNFLIEQRGRDYWYRWGGMWHSHLATPQDKKEVTSLCYDHAALLPHSITLEVGAGGAIGLVHAEPPNDWHYAQSSAIDYQKMVWSRDRINWDNQKHVHNIDYVLVGHHVDTHVRRMGNVYYIDTGSGYEGGHITLLEVTENLQKELETLASGGSIK